MIIQSGTSVSLKHSGNFPGGPVVDTLLPTQKNHWQYQQATKRKKKYQKSVALQKKSKSLMHYRSNNKMRQLWNCLKRFSCSLSDNESISKKSKESLQLNNKTQIIQLENKQIWIDIFPHTHTHKICIQMANRYMKGCSTWLIIREMQIKITVRYLYVF